MKNKYTVFLLVLAFFAQTIYSQEQQNKYGAGVRVGLNMSSIAFENDDTDNSIGFHAGMVFDIPLINLGFGTLYFQPGVMFNAKGGEISESDDEYDYEYENSYGLNYLEVPLLASLKVPINESFSIRANAGAYIAFGLLGTWESKATEEGEIHSDETSFPIHELQR